MSKRKIKAAAATVQIPQSREECTGYIASIGKHQRERERIQSAMNDVLADIRLRYEEEARPYAEAIKALSQGVQMWCETMRDTLTSGGKTKTVNLAAGEVRWRTRPPRVARRGGVKEETIIEDLKSAGLTQCVRTKEELNKEAILADPAAVAHIRGLSVEQGEDFIIVPFETDLEEVA
ncbi:MAG: host-nuclease inhibitor Gam family protein [Immundisolibacter sp.]|uniref:host-nuclease inhibitor Gam family protein n=1 Tax=Immundisolibacter sp. TaxID=1934948 RepID=UPI0019A977D2|nr:host-nuclease inhibitor Gam family protein [Immundisolibacter sp.]MBC7162730.1 host-nuclease inhibitor Gam family protein [Immundisolibacter sp.]